MNNYNNNEIIAQYSEELEHDGQKYQMEIKSWQAPFNKTMSGIHFHTEVIISNGQPVAIRHLPEKFHDLTSLITNVKDNLGKLIEAGI